MPLFESLTSLVGSKAATVLAGLTVAGGAVAGAGVDLPDLPEDTDTVAEARVNGQEGELPEEANGGELPEEANGGENEAQGEGGLPEDLPEQSRAPAVHAAIDATEPGPERGTTVSTAARGDAGTQGAEARSENASTGGDAADAGAANGDEESGEDTSNAPDEGDQGAANAERRGTDRP